MKAKNAVGPFSLALLFVFASFLPADDNSSLQADLFSMDGKSIITDPGHLGIINGKLTVGTPHGQVGRVDGLWAPPYVSSDFALNVEVFGKEVATQSYRWWPFKVERHGVANGVEVSAVTMLVPGKRGGLVAITLHNTTQKTLDVPVAFKTRGTLDSCDFWEFSGARSSTATKSKVKQNELTLTAGKLSIVMQGSCDDLKWDAKRKVGRQVVILKPDGCRTICLVFAMDTSAEAKAACESMATDPTKAIAAADATQAKQVAKLFKRLPRLVSANKQLKKYYNRSLIHFITNRWDVPEFVLNPYYSTGSIRGGCVCDYLWNYGEIWEIMPLFDPAAHREHIKQFLKCDMTKHFSFNPIDGKAFGPWYMVNQEKIIGMIYYYIKNTGDTAFLEEVVDGKSVLEHVLKNATVLDNVSKPVELIDYGPSNSHLELRRRRDAYNHVMPDLNGRRHANYLRAARLAEIAGKPAPYLLERAGALKKLLKQRQWNPKTKWFDFTNGQGKAETRWTVQMFKLFGSSVLDEETEAGLMSHLNEQEFLSEHGLHSLAKGDPEYDTNDVDNGGPGACTCFPPQIAERLYKAGHSKQGEDILQRCLWWGSRLPYWGDSIVAERIDYRHDTPLQCTVDGVTVAQAIIFGMFGVDAQFDGSILVSPRPPSFAPQMSLKGVKIRGVVFDIDVDDNKFKVTSGGKTIVASVGRTVSIKNNGKLEQVDDRKGAGEY